MKQAVMTEPGRIVFQEVPVPEVGSNQIEVKMKAIGVCGSDIHVWHGKHPYTTYPVVQGHEISAVVTKIGTGVTTLSVGDAVTIQPQVVCGVCYPCTHGLYNDCEHLKVMGFQTTGMASEYFVTEADKAIKLPEGMSFEHGAMIEPLAVAVHAHRRYGSTFGKRILVIGGGTIGNLVAQTAKALGAKDVLISEVSSYRLAAATKCGILASNPKEKTVRDSVYEYFGSDGADCIFECTGSPACIAGSIELARKGSDIIVVGVVPDLAPVNMGFVQDHELRISGTAMYRSEDYREAIRLINEGLIDFDTLITHRVPFSRYESAYQMIEEQKDKAMKVIIEMEK
jgi:L-iditol 2-dehydrogenase